MSAKSNAPVIIKRKKSGGGEGHHGGAWKVAYADFVTAMMAFFMLMWLLNATTEKQRKGIADYFNPTIPINRISGGGEGAFGGDSVFAEQTLAQNGTGASESEPSEKREARGSIGTQDAGNAADATDRAAFEAVAEALTARSGESMVSELARRHIITRITDEGLVVEIHDLDDAPLFEVDTDTPTPLLQDITAMIAEVFAVAANPVAVAAHVRAYPEVLRKSPVWDLSQGRADRTRQMLAGSGLDESRFRRVTGFADRQPAVRNPFAPRNNRVEITLLRSKI